MAVTLLGALWLSAALETRLMATQIDMSVRLVLSRLLRAGLFVLALLIALTAVGIDLTCSRCLAARSASGSAGCRRLQRITWAALPCCWNAAFASATA